MRKVQTGGVIRTSLDNTWQTPREILERTRVYFGGPIPFDPATASDNPTAATRFCSGPAGTLFARDSLESRNGLEVAWEWPVFVNPPYGEELRDWLGKLVAEASRGAEVVALLPCSRWEQAYFTRTLAAARAVCFHEGRIKFISSKDGVACGGNPSASMLLGFNVDLERFAEAFGPLGPCFVLGPITPTNPKETRT